MTSSWRRATSTEYELDKNVQTETREEFVARRIGHDTARTKYAVDRTPSRQPDPPSDQMSVVNEPAQAVGV